MKRKFTAIVGISTTLILTACGSNGQSATTGSSVSSPPGTHYTFYQDLPDGGKVLCIWVSTSSSYGGNGGLSCDWESLHQAPR